MALQIGLARNVIPQSGHLALVIERDFRVDRVDIVGWLLGFNLVETDNVERMSGGLWSSGDGSDV